MNYRGSYRKLLGNAQAAMIAAIEIYNKPVFKYRDECVVILLLNAWELLLKALLSKNGDSVFYKKRRKEAYRTLSWSDAFTKSEKYFPPSIAPLPVKKNLDLLGTYRDNSVHFYNEKEFGALLYALAQTSIKNFRDLLDAKLSIKLEEQVNWQLLPIGIRPPVDLVAYLTGRSAKEKSAAVRQYLSEFARAVEEVRAVDQDSGRLLTIFNVKLESVKKIGEADAVVGVQKGGDSASGPLAIIRTQDPNITHPLKQRGVVDKIDTLYGKKFTTHTFQAIAWKHGLKDNSQYCWKASDGNLVKYSNDVLAFINRLTQADVDAAMTDYKTHLRTRSRRAARA